MDSQTWFPRCQLCGPILAHSVSDADKYTCQTKDLGKTRTDGVMKSGGNWLLRLLSSDEKSCSICLVWRNSFKTHLWEGMMPVAIGGLQMLWCPNHTRNDGEEMHRYRKLQTVFSCLWSIFASSQRTESLPSVLDWIIEGDTRSIHHHHFHTSPDCKIWHHKVPMMAKNQPSFLKIRMFPCDPYFPDLK